MDQHLDVHFDQRTKAILNFDGRRYWLLADGAIRLVQPGLSHHAAKKGQYGQRAWFGLT
jgi:hypothetical protein